MPWNDIVAGSLPLVECPGHTAEEGMLELPLAPTEKGSEKDGVRAEEGGVW
jgi:hypothetical protein